MSATDEISPARSKTEHSPELAAYYADKPLMWRNVALIGFSIGIVMSTVGLVMFFIHHRLMRRKAAEPASEKMPLQAEIG